MTWKAQYQQMRVYQTIQRLAKNVADMRGMTKEIYAPSKDLDATINVANIADGAALSAYGSLDMLEKKLEKFIKNYETKSDEE